MTTDLVTHLLLGLLPVCCFLAALVYLDSYKLVPIRRVLAVIALGCLTAALSYPFSVIGLDLFGIDFTAYTRYVAPAIEEALKAAIVVILLLIAVGTAVVFCASCPRHSWAPGLFVDSAPPLCMAALRRSLRLPPTPSSAKITQLAPRRSYLVTSLP